MLTMLSIILILNFFSLLSCSAKSISSTNQANENLQIIIIGDWGIYDFMQGNEKVARGMALWAEDNDPAWILTVGDNFYPKGLRSPTDPQVDSKWRNMYTNESLVDLVWHITLGNHDYGDWEGEEWNEVELGKIEPRWSLPHLWYDFVETRGDFSAHFIIIDTESFTKAIERNNYTEMIPWFETVLHESTADWKFVVGHRHIFSAGDHGPVTSSLYNAFVGLMEANNVDAYICGHDHNVQHIQHESGVGMDYIVSGNGGAGIYLHSQENEDHIKEFYQHDTHFFQALYGFVTLELSRENAKFDFWNKDAELQYTYTRTKTRS